jgi:hypothetical protein
LTFKGTRLESMTGCRSRGNEIPAGWLAELSGKSAGQSFGAKSPFLDMLLKLSFFSGLRAERMI